MDITWQVVAGEESQEVEIENQRERRVLEAVYPRPSAIPPKFDSWLVFPIFLLLACTFLTYLFPVYSPSVSMDIEQSQYSDQQTPLIPITPIEDEETALDAPSGLIAPFSISVSSQPPVLAHGVPLPSQVSIPTTANSLVSEKRASGMALGVDPDVVAAASAALTQISKSNQHGNLIDHDLLIKLLSNPKSIEKLVTDYGGASNAQNIPKATLPSVPVSDHHPPPVAVSDPSSVRFNMMETSSPSLVATTSNGGFYAQANGVGVGHHPNSWIKPPGVVPASASPSFVPSQPRDLNYYKNLIQQHGGDRQETLQQFGNRLSHQQPGTSQEFANNPKSRDSKPKIMKPCIYFNSSRGCRHGSKCAYQHDTSSQQRSNNMPEGQNAKRMKLDRQISS